jgi:sulfonate transport system permease protein
VSIDSLASGAASGRSAAGEPSPPAPPAGARPRRRRLSLDHWWLRAITLAVAIGIWQLLSATGVLPSSKLVSPASIAHTTYTLITTTSPTYGTLQGSLLVSAERLVIGFTIGVLVAALFAIVTGLSRVGEIALDPIVQALRGVPLLGLLPLFIIWFGIGELPKVLIVVLGAFFPMYVNTFAGIRSVDPKLRELGRVLGLTRRELITQIVLPGALPQALTGLRLGVVSSLLALVVGEQVNANAGLGFMITTAQDFLQNNIIMVALIVYAILGVLADTLVRLLERKVLTWRSEFVQ